MRPPPASRYEFRPRHQHGVALLELLIGITIGLLVVMAAIGTLMISRGASASVSDVSQLQQQAAYALRVIGLQLRQAGSIDPVFKTDTQLFSFNASYTGYGGTSAALSGTEGDTSPDVLNTSMGLADQLSNYQRDCLGNSTTTPSVEAIFSLTADGQLRCKGVKATPQPIIQNVADFQVRYRVLGGTSVQVMKADAVAAGDLWADVHAVEVCIDMQGTEPLPDAGSTYLDCNGTSRSRGGRIHLVYRNVFGIRADGAAP